MKIPPTKEVLEGLEELARIGGWETSMRYGPPRRLDEAVTWMREFIKWSETVESEIDVKNGDNDKA